MRDNYDVAVIGGGAAGMMAAIGAAISGASVVLFEKNESLGLKVLATGNGRCNISNQNISKAHYHGSVCKYFDEIYSQFDKNALENFLSDNGLVLVTEDRGRMFPKSNKATTVVDTLAGLLDKNGVTIFTSTTVRGIEKKDDWAILLDDRTVVSKKIVLTTGGKASFRLGSSGDGLFWSMKLGHKLSEIYAALVPIELETKDFVTAMGVKMKVIAKAMINNKEVVTKSGDLLFTHFGVSGPAAMGLAGTIAPAVETGRAEIAVDLLPEISAKHLENALVDAINENPKKSIENILSEILPKKLSISLLTHIKLNGSKKGAEVSKVERKEIVEATKSLRLLVKKLRPLKEAQVTSGGVLESEIDSKLASMVSPNLYFAGEILDIDGDSGGYNLQWAWSSGMVAGRNAARSLK